jgi:hypothetical protein
MRKEEKSEIYKYKEEIDWTDKEKKKRSGDRNGRKEKD